VHGWDRLTRDPNVLKADLWIEPGQVVAPVTDAFSRHGVFMVGGDTAAEVERLVEELNAALVFETDQYQVGMGLDD